MSEPLHIGEIITRWQGRQQEWLRLHVQVDGAALADEFLSDLEKIAASNGDDELTLTDAADLSGYSTDHLSRLIREGKLANHGRKGAPRIRRSDCPMRPKSPVAKRDGIAYDAVTDARLSLGVRR